MSQNPAHVQLAHAILATAKLREESFDHGTAARMQANGEMCDFDKLYRLSIRDAAEVDGMNPFLSFPVYLLLTNSWNDALEWAKLNAK